MHARAMQDRAGMVGRKSQLCYYPGRSQFIGYSRRSVQVTEDEYERRLMILQENQRVNSVVRGLIFNHNPLHSSGYGAARKVQRFPSAGG
jgi:hypothetical protein